MNEERSVEFLRKVLGVVEWLNTSHGESAVSLTPFDNEQNPIFQCFQKELKLSQEKVIEREAELKRVRLENFEVQGKLKLTEKEVAEMRTELEKFRIENCKLRDVVESKEEEIQKLKGALEREKWGKMHAEVSMADMGRQVAKLYERIDDLLASIRTNGEEEIEDEDDDIQIVAVRNICGEGGSYEELWKKFGHLRSWVTQKYRKWEEYGDETRRQLENTKRFMENISEILKNVNKGAECEINVEDHTATTDVKQEKSHNELSPVNPLAFPSPPPANLNDIPINEKSSLIHTLPQDTKVRVNFFPGQSPGEEVKESSTLTLTFHNASRSPSPCELPPNQVFSDSMQTYSPMTSPISPPFQLKPNLPTSSVIKFASCFNYPEATLPQYTTGTPSSPPPPEETFPQDIRTEDIIHGVDPSRRHLGFYCLCGLQCSTKKTLQYHLQYLESHHITSTDGNITNQTIHTLPTLRNQQNRSKKCRSCGKFYTGGKEGLRRHILEEHPSHHKTTTSSVHATTDSSDNLQYHVDHHKHETSLHCNDCPETFRTIVQLRLHHKVKHNSTHQFQPRANWNEDDIHSK